jgi:adenosylcobinamide-phosphate synthase
MKYTTIALAAGFLIDLAAGDPRWLYHPVILIGKLISVLEHTIRSMFPETDQGEFLGGILEVLLVCAASFLIPFGILLILYRVCTPAGLILETFWCWQLFACKSLKTESMKVYDKLTNGTLEEARTAVSMIVGRDTAALDETGVTKAAVETVAENTSDGIIAPMFYMAIGGAPLMFLYKGINTMDSMLGYKNDQYLYFGRCAARLDDVVNYIPSRLSGLLMILASRFVGLDMAGAFRIFKRDRYNHASPNSAQTEAVMAGALGVQLAGNAYYFGKLYKKPTIGDPTRAIEVEDIRRANQLLYATAILGMLVFLAVRIAFGM